MRLLAVLNVLFKDGRGRCPMLQDPFRPVGIAPVPNIPNIPARGRYPTATPASLTSRLELIYRIAVLSLETRSRNCWFSRISLSGFFIVSFYASLRGDKPLTVAERRQAGDRRATLLLRAPQLV